jgi:hypothetical protein
MICPSCSSFQSGNSCKLCNEIFKPKKEPKLLQRSKTPIKKVSKSQGIINTAKAKQMKGFKEEREGWCSGCGTPSLLTNSHLVPVGQNKNLELNKLNQVWHCVDKCHYTFEHLRQERKKMLDYASNMEKIKELDLVYYNLIVGKNGY